MVFRMVKSYPAWLFNSSLLKMAQLDIVDLPIKVVDLSSSLR